jgi:hypothetical protein
MSKKHNSGIWEYLDSVGVLEKGSDEEIKAAKKAYRKKYFLAYKQKQRVNKPEYTINFKKENGEHERIFLAAKKHRMTVTSFIRSSALAYLTQTFLVPNREQVARLEQLLSECLNEVKAIVSGREKYFWQRQDKLDQIEKRIQKLEGEINEIFRNPPLLHHDHQNQIA